MVLFRSHLRRPAPVYEPLARFPTLLAFLSLFVLVFEHLFD